MCRSYGEHYILCWIYTISDVEMTHGFLVVMEEKYEWYNTHVGDIKTRFKLTNSLAACLWDDVL